MSHIIDTNYLAASCVHRYLHITLPCMYVAILYNNYVHYYVEQQLDYSADIYSCFTIISTSFTSSQM